MSPRRRILIVVLLLFALLDGLAYTFTLSVKNAPSVEQVTKAARATPPPPPSPVTQQKDAYLETFSLNGTWLYLQTGSEEGDYASPDANLGLWRKMTLPSNWYLAGLNYHGVIWFRREFPANPAWQGRLVQVEFDGVDYFTDVWLNGVKVGQHEGNFQPFAFDISRQINYNGSNLLVVKVDSPYEEYGAVWPLKKTLIKGIFGQDRARPGGAWSDAGQEYNTGGIWGDIKLNVSNFVSINQTRYQASWPVPLPQGNNPVFRGEILLTNASQLPAAVEVNLALTPANFYEDAARMTARQVTLQRGQNKISVEMPVDNPRLWWPWDRGLPNLYKAQLQVLLGGVQIASQETVFGFRDVQVSSGYEWTVNGQKYFPRGTNYASTQWQTLATPALLRKDAALVRNANLNLVRVYAHVEPPEFYNLMDQAGILVWQDFPLIWGYADTPAFADDAQAQLGQMIFQLFNHPSIVAWCMHEESPWATSSISKYVKNYDSRQNKRLDDALQSQAKKLDPTRYVHLNSGTGDSHVFTGWSQGKWTDFASLPGQPFVTEYGAQALPDLDAMLKLFNLDDLNFNSGDGYTRWAFQGFQVTETLNVAKINTGKSGISDIRTFITNSQAYQANLLQYATESYRRAKYKPMTGIFQYMFVDEWPSVTFSVVDVNRQPKPGYAALRTAMQPILPSIVPTAPPTRLEGASWVYADASQLGISIWVVNDTLNAYPNAKLEWIFTADDQAAPLAWRTIDVTPDDASLKIFLKDLGLKPASYRLDVTLKDAQGVNLGANQFSFTVLPPATK